MRNEEQGLLRGDSLSFRDAGLSFKQMIMLKATPEESSAKPRDNS